MSGHDKKIATFYSSFDNGDVELLCCSCVFSEVYLLRYVISFHTPEGVKDAVSSRMYGVNEYELLLCDVIELINTPLLERD